MDRGRLLRKRVPPDAGSAVGRNEVIWASIFYMLDPEEASITGFALPRRLFVQKLISFEEAQSIELDAVPRQPTVEVSLDDALGRTLAVPIHSRDAIPPFDNSARDGYAVRAGDVEDVPARLRVIEEVMAGTPPTRTVQSGTCSQIMTGAPVPEGADAIVPVEWTERDGNVVRVDRRPDRGQFVRPSGQDVTDGEQIFEAGTVVTPPVVGMLATVGAARVEVRVPPKVAVVATGDELVEPSASLRPGQIRNSNGPALAAQVQTAGGDPVGPFHAGDDVEEIRHVVGEALAEADVLVFSGGVSMGEHDLVRDVLDEMGFEAAFWKVRQRPGKPLTFGTLDGRPVFGLPGNPVSSAVCFDQHVRPALATMLGRTERIRPRHPAVLEEETSKVEDLHHFTRGRVRVSDEGRLRVFDTGPQASNLYSSVVQANCLIHLPEGLAEARAGMTVNIERFSW